MSDPYEMTALKQAELRRASQRAHGIQLIAIDSVDVQGSASFSP
jgi:hypothetical protein